MAKLKQWIESFKSITASFKNLKIHGLTIKTELAFNTMGQKMLYKILL